MTTKPRAYLSGPMTGIDDYNYPEFHRVTAILRGHGWYVANPAESFSGNQDLDFSTYMRWDIERLLHVDTIVLLPGWVDAVGAVFEVAIGSALGLEILEYRDELGGFSTKPALPLFDTDRDRLGFVLGTPVPQPELDYERLVAEHGAGSPEAEDGDPRRIKVGDLVKVVNPIGPVLYAGSVHKVRHVSPPFVYIGTPSDGWHRDRFEVVDLTGPIVATPPAGPEPMSTWAEADNGLLKAADHIVNGDRQRTYGHPINHHTTTSALWSAYLTRVNDPKGTGPIEVVVRPQDVSVLMILDKVSRVAGGDKVDNVLDIAGYAQVHAKVRARQEAGA